MQHQNQSMTTNSSQASVINATHIHFLCWNIKKGKKLNWQYDLQSLVHDKDLVIIQEAVLHADLLDVFESSVHYSFAKGYRSRKHSTGVVTISKHAPLNRYQLTSWEPWLATPKAIHITEFSLAKSSETLIVINIHTINFTIGIRQYKRQIDQIRNVLQDHQGPVILSGDFNTWRKKRMNILDALAVDHSLIPLSFSKDHRKSVFGKMLDHVYVRSLIPEDTKTHHVTSSDHNPMTAQLRI